MTNDRDIEGGWLRGRKARLCCALMQNGAMGRSEIRDSVKSPAAAQAFLAGLCNLEHNAGVAAVDKKLLEMPSSQENLPGSNIHLEKMLLSGNSTESIDNNGFLVTLGKAGISIQGLSQNRGRVDIALDPSHVSIDRQLVDWSIKLKKAIPLVASQTSADSNSSRDSKKLGTLGLGIAKQMGTNGEFIILYLFFPHRALKKKTVNDLTEQLSKIIDSRVVSVERRPALICSGLPPRYFTRSHKTIRPGLIIEATDHPPNFGVKGAITLILKERAGGMVAANIDGRTATGDLVLPHGPSSADGPPDRQPQSGSTS